MDPKHPLLQKTRRRLYLLRHADVNYFDAQGHLQQLTTISLNAQGRAQAEAAAREFASVPLDLVVSSDLLRSVETATVVSQGRGLNVQTRAELREIQPGRLSELPAQSIEQLFLGAFGDDISLGTPFLGGETFGALQDRVLDCLSGFLVDTSWRHLLLVAHGGVNRVILSHALGLGLRGFAVLEQDPCCVNVIDVDDAGGYLVRLVNHTPYNPLKRGLERTTMERLYLQFRRQL